MPNTLPAIHLTYFTMNHQQWFFCCVTSQQEPVYQFQTESHCTNMSQSCLSIHDPVSATKSLDFLPNSTSNWEIPTVSHTDSFLKSSLLQCHKRAYSSCA